MDNFSNTLASWFGEGEGWFRGVIQFMGGSTILILSYFLFAGIHGAFVGIFIDDILDVIHQRYYPDVQWNKPPPFLTSCLFSARIFLMTIFLNIIASPLLLVGWFIPPLGLALQIFLNGYLLGKEYGQLVELRFPKGHSLTPIPKYFSNGNIAAIIWIIPIVNLIAPILLAGSVLHSRMNLKTQ
ncbi:EI24 domain-containing protein [bacterium]|nr:EI24 domain-containing protein [bacterium]